MRKLFLSIAVMALLFQGCTINKQGKIVPIKLPQASKPAGQNKPAGQGQGNQGNQGNQNVPGNNARKDVFKANGIRYKDKVFQSTTTQKVVVANNIPTWDNKRANITVDLYFPAGDVEKKRPCVVFYFGGAWASKMKNGIAEFNQEMAMRGYVTVTGDYRVGFQNSNGVLICLGNPKEHMIEAAYRGLQDVKALIRHLRANADAYGIDPNKIYVGGGSAGGANAINAAFIDEDEIPIPMSSKIGGIESVGAYQNVSSKPNAVFSLAGPMLLGDEEVFEKNNIPAYLLQGQCDELIPFESGQTFPHCKNGNYPTAIGCMGMYEKLKAIGNPVKMDVVCRGGHDAFGWGFVELNQRVASFCYDVMNGTFKTSLGVFMPETEKCPGKSFPNCQ